MLRDDSGKILVLCHEASYTGAPILLLSLMRLLRQQYFISFHTVLLKGGPLEKEFALLGSVTVLKPADYSSKRKDFKRILSVIRSRLMLLKVYAIASKCDIVFSNSIVNGHILKGIRFFNKAILTYVHELDSITEVYPLERVVRPSVELSTLLLYPCEKVKTFLQEKFGVVEKRLARLNYFFTPDALELKADITSRSSKLQICGVGTASYRKGTDLFIEVAHLVLQQNKNISFTWVGGFSNIEDETGYRKMVSDYGLTEHLEFTGLLAPEKVKQTYSQFDVLFLSSREDPYPLVVLEAAYQKKPTITFSESGGIVEFVNNDNGWVVQGFSVWSAAELILGIQKAEAEIKGRIAYEKVLDWHFNSALILKQFNFAVSVVKDLK